MTEDERRRTPEVYAEKKDVLRHRVWELFGFSALYAWMLCSALGSALYRSSGLGAWSQTFRICLILGIVAASAILVALRKRIRLEGTSDAGLILLGLAGSAGTVLSQFPQQGAIAWVLAGAAGLVCGTANSMLLCLVNRYWAAARPERSMMQLTVSAFAATVIYFIALALPRPASVIFICLLPLIGAYILTRTDRPRKRAGSYRTLDRSKTRDPRLIVCFSAISLAAGCVFGLTATDDLGTFVTQSSIQMVGFVLGTAVSLVIALLVLPTRFFKIAGRPSVPLMMIGIILMLVPIEGAEWIGAVVVVCGYVLTDLFMQQLCAELVFRTKLPATDILMHSQLDQWGFLAIGFALACAAKGYLIPASSFSMPALLAGCLILLIVTQSFVFDADNANAMILARNSYGLEYDLTETYDIIAERYALTARETEVFEMLAKGRSAVYISDELKLSPTTVKSHIRSIYRKLGISRKQELLDLIEAETK